MVTDSERCRTRCCWRGWFNECCLIAISSNSEMGSKSGIATIGSGIDALQAAERKCEGLNGSVDQGCATGEGLRTDLNGRGVDDLEGDEHMRGTWFRVARVEANGDGRVEAIGLWLQTGNRGRGL